MKSLLNIAIIAVLLGVFSEIIKKRMQAKDLDFRNSEALRAIGISIFVFVGTFFVSTKIPILSEEMYSYTLIVFCFLLFVLLLFFPNEERTNFRLRFPQAGFVSLFLLTLFEFYRCSYFSLAPDFQRLLTIWFFVVFLPIITFEMSIYFGKNKRKRVKK